MSDRLDTTDTLPEATGEAISTYWREILNKVSTKVGDQMAATGMFMVALEAFRGGMGNEAAADLLEKLAEGVRAGDPVSVSIDRGTEH